MVVISKDYACASAADVVICVHVQNVPMSCSKAGKNVLCVKLLWWR